MDELHLDWPFAGSQMLRDPLRAEGVVIGRVAVSTLMRRIGIEALYRRPNTSEPALGHKIYPYLLRKRVVDRPNEVWAMDITYISMARGFVYLAAAVAGGSGGWRRWWIGSAGGFWPGGCRSRWRQSSGSDCQAPIQGTAER